jgi:uncharacterized protein DUF4255
MIDDLDKSIETLLVQELPSELASQVHISFEPPDSSFPPHAVTLPAVDLFLYDVRENTELRNTDVMFERTPDDHATAWPPVVRVDCSYLVTAWPSDSSPTPAQDEHRLLGEVLLVLLRHPTLPAAVLQGDLAVDELPLPTTTLQQSRLQSSGEFWQALGGKPKATIAFGVTIPVRPGVAEDLGPVVKERLLPITRIES